METCKGLRHLKELFAHPGSVPKAIAPWSESLNLKSSILRNIPPLTGIASDFEGYDEMISEERFHLELTFGQSIQTFGRTSLPDQINGLLIFQRDWHAFAIDHLQTQDMQKEIKMQEIQSAIVRDLEEVCDEAIITIRCLSAIPEEVELLLEELANQEEQEQN